MKQTMEEVHLTTIKPRNEVLLLAQEISFAKVLSCNDKRLRDRGIRRLKKWFMARSQGESDFTKDDFMRIWKGLFYCMWMSDKPLVQEELAEQISHLIHSFASFKTSLLFVETFFASLSIEWFGIDQLRLDKFMMLVRRFMRQSLELVARHKWRETETQKLADVYLQSLKTAPLGLCMHIVEVFCEELAKIGKGELSSSTILQFITVFARHLATLKDGRMISQITRYVFLHLIRQSELGIEHQMKFSAWKEYGFPGGDLDAGERVEVEPESDEEMMAGSEDGEEEERLTADDARAGKVDVLLPPLDFDYRDLLTVLRQLRNDKETTTKGRKTLMQLISKYENLANGKYPLGLHKIELAAKIDKKKEITQAARRIVVEEEKLMDNESGTDESDSERVPLAKKTAKKLAKKKLKSNWKVSNVNVSNKPKESESNSSWNISESNSADDSSPNSTRKRKINEGSKTTDVLNKKVRNSSISSASESKENKSSSPVASTPKISKKNILKKTTTNDQNVSDNNTPSPNTSKGKRKTRKSVNTPLTTNNDSVDKKADASVVLEDTSATSNKKRRSSRNSKEEGETVIVLKESDKNNGWGGDWDAPADDVAYELFVPNKKYVEKRKSQGLSYPVSSLVQKSAEKKTPMSLKTKCLTPGSQKKVEFNLSANCSQEYKDYAKKLKSRKSDVAFDASKKPSQGLLKSFTPSPINPFYKKKLKFLSSPKNNSFS